eukprot:CAMPEP_0197526768 /NCGR_PEP_ID=MMETSP1318-20131121/19284_1 /TAXON_ID=552666 /ORGANISM="Partenskyella glossopodia, Strain RCC365" /LENGTH=363 /DNA_ID=CAMNT_0043081097 /DNA_START=73 /DNA_END=1161 /DNA_ORIENTATION=-
MVRRRAEEQGFRVVVLLVVAIAGVDGRVVGSNKTHNLNVAELDRAQPLTESQQKFVNSSVEENNKLDKIYINDGKQQRIRIRGNWTYADEEWAKLQKKRREIEAAKAKLYDDSVRYAIDKAEEQQEKHDWRMAGDFYKISSNATFSNWTKLINNFSSPMTEDFLDSVLPPISGNQSEAVSQLVRKLLKGDRLSPTDALSLLIPDAQDATAKIPFRTAKSTAKPHVWVEGADSPKSRDVDVPIVLNPAVFMEQQAFSNAGGCESDWGLSLGAECATTLMRQHDNSWQKRCCSWHMDKQSAVCTGGGELLGRKLSLSQCTKRCSETAGCTHVNFGKGSKNGDCVAVSSECLDYIPDNEGDVYKPW